MAIERRYQLALIIMTILQAGLAAFYLNALSRIDNWSAVYAEDSRGYLLAADYCRGREPTADDLPLMKYRLFSPVMPCAAALLGTFIGVPAAFVTLNFMLWNITALVFFRLMKVLLKEPFCAFAGAALFTTSLPVIEWGLPVMVDMAAYFFACLIPGLYLALFPAPPSINNADTRSPLFAEGVNGWSPAGRLILYKNLLLSLCVGLALLTKPMLVIGLLFVLFSLIHWRRYGSAIIQLVVPIAMAGTAYWFCGLSWEDFTAYGSPRHRSVIYLVSAAVFCFHWGWVFFWHEWRTALEQKQFYIFYLAAFLCVFVWFVHNPRLFFLVYPAVLPLIAAGIHHHSLRTRNPHKTAILLIAGYIATSNVLAILHLYVMRYLKIRDWEGLIDFVSRLI